MPDLKKTCREQKCKKCMQPDADRMVQCNKCGSWYHYECVGVNIESTETGWSCECATPIPASPIVAVSTSSELFNSTMTAPYSSTGKELKAVAGSNVHHVPDLSILALKHSAIAPPATSTMNQSTFGGPNQHSQHVAEAHNQYTQNVAEAPIMIENMLEQMRKLFEQTHTYSDRACLYSENHSGDNVQNDMAAPPQNVNKNANLAYANKNSNLNLQQNLIQIPSAVQIAARQAIPNNLPAFDGDPQQWPLFFSSFETSTKIAGFSNAENLMRLQSCLKGKARELVQSRLMLPAMVPEIIQTLRMCFGRPELIINSLVNKARQLPPPKDKLEPLIEYSLCVRNIYSTMEACHLNAHMHNPMLVQELVDKLPTQLKLTWAMHPKNSNEPSVKVFSDWIYNIAQAASQVSVPLYNYKGANVHHHRSDSHSYSSSVQTTAKCASCNSNGHKVHQCEAFLKMSLQEKQNVVRAKQLCYRCLNNHRRKCFSNKLCGVGGCSAKHHSLLHGTVIQHPTSENAISSGNVHNHRNAANIKEAYFRIVPIRIHTLNKFINTFAFLDEGSSVTLIEENTFSQLNLRGAKQPLCLRWTGDTVRMEDSSKRANIKIENINTGAKFTLRNVHSVGDLSLPVQTIDMDSLAMRYPHLKGLPIESYKNARPTILIGTNNWNLAVPLKVREGSWRQPIASKTRLGWTIQGGDITGKSEVRVNIHTCSCERYNAELHQAVKLAFSLDVSPEKSIMSASDTMVLKTLDSTAILKDGRYEIGLPWNEKSENLPSSYEHAYQRLMCLSRRFNKQPNLRCKIQNEIDNLLAKKYARKVTAEELSNNNKKVWYLPTFITVNPNKPDRIRLVWDAAAQSKGQSLNDFIHRGPDLLNSLLDLLIAFRVGRVAVCGDIAEMFHQIRVRTEDMHAQRFLWWDKNDPVTQPSVYVMESLTFGINCAPCIAHYIRDKNADRFENQYPEAVDAIKRYHYVDDFIFSADSISEASQIALQVKAIHASGGFNIRNWSSNSIDVLQKLSTNKTTTQAVEIGTTEKVLGLYWMPENDQFKFVFKFSRLRRNVFEDPDPPTKRELLQVLMSIYDPLGFLSCYTIGLKIAMQEAWRSGSTWDEAIHAKPLEEWMRWKKIMPVIENTKIPRCYIKTDGDIENIQLHTFVDASELAYAAICFLRIKQGGQTHVSLVAAKAKVAPLLPLSIPRLELQAAVLGTKLARKIQNNYRVTINSSWYWSDSKTVLKWLRMDPRKFQQFVMHRVGEILEHTNISQWHWVPSKVNPADCATKVCSNNSCEKWFAGPEFLLKDESAWPTCNDLGPMNTDEIRAHVLLIQNGQLTDMALNIEYFSNWRKLYRALATFLLYMARLRAASQKLPLPQTITAEMLNKAKLILYRQAQASEYKPEIASLLQGKSIERTSKLISLNIFIDNEQILRVRGRTDYLNNVHAIVLPYGHYITRLIVRWQHEKYHHTSHETCINLIRGDYYIPRLRVLYKNVRRTCQRCKNDSAKPDPPQMAPLPIARLSSFERPFTYTGIDYFGPLYVTVGRRREKRWGVIFTCLTIRAVHLEIAHTLDTSSCVMSIRNFIARRGTPREIYTDNGTNFKATQKIFCDEKKNIEINQIAARFDNIHWKFNPPAAPHMGGAWERLVRSVKTVMYSICPSMNFTDESLKCVFCEIEFILNSRPLTFVSLDSNDDDAITPNHLLLGSASAIKPIIDAGTNVRYMWQATQAFADKFWRRWILEYIPDLTRRGKWFSKRPPITIGSIVIIVDETLKRNQWPKGIVEEVVLAKDGQARRVVIKTSSGLLVRPVAKVAVLDVGISGCKPASEPASKFAGGRMLPPFSEVSL